MCFVVSDFNFTFTYKHIYVITRLCIMINLYLFNYFDNIRHVAKALLKRKRTPVPAIATAVSNPADLHAPPVASNDRAAVSVLY
jgi:hypothetical protein